MRRRHDEPVTDVNSPVVFADRFTQWRVDWITLAASAAVVVGYLRARRAAHRQGVPWPLRRDVLVALGLLAALWTSCGFLQARGDQLMWVWTTQQLLLLLVVPIIVLAGQPVALLRRTGSAPSGCSAHVQALVVGRRASATATTPDVRSPTRACPPVRRRRELCRCRSAFNAGETAAELRYPSAVEGRL